MHVPEDKLPEYRLLMGQVRRYTRLGNQASNHNDHAEANRLWALSAAHRDAAYALRVPGQNEGEKPSLS